MRWLLPILVLFPGLCWGHDFTLEVAVADGVVHGKARFDDSQPVTGTWKVFRADERAPLDGGTLTRGEFRWTPPAQGRYRVEAVEVGLHKAFAEVEVTALPPPPTPTPSAAPAASSAARPTRTSRSRVKRIATGLAALLVVTVVVFSRKRGGPAVGHSSADGSEVPPPSGPEDETAPPGTG